MEFASVVVAFCALGFTLASFWWLHVRRGQLVTAAPTVFAAAFTPGSLRIRIPLLIENTGPVPLVIEEMLLVGVEAGEEWPWISLRRGIRPEEDDVVDFTSAAVVRGRDVLHLFVEFGTNKAAWRPEPSSRQSFTVRLRKRGGSWDDLVTFDLVMPGQGTMNRYIAHRAIDHDC